MPERLMCTKCGQRPMIPHYQRVQPKSGVCSKCHSHYPSRKHVTNKYRRSLKGRAMLDRIAQKHGFADWYEQNKFKNRSRRACRRIQENAI